MQISTTAPGTSICLTAVSTAACRDAWSICFSTDPLGDGVAPATGGAHACATGAPAEGRPACATPGDTTATDQLTTSTAAHARERLNIAITAFVGDSVPDAGCA
ncbi:hypothetical protein GCM10028775_51850 [Catellatospora paridis]